MGFTVTRSGYVFKDTGWQLRKNFKIINGRIDRMYIRFFHEGKDRQIGYQRFIYKAWHPEFDWDNKDLVVVSTSQNRFDTHVDRLTVITRKELLDRNAKLTTKITEEEMPQVIDTWEQLKGYMTFKQFAEELDISPEHLRIKMTRYADENEIRNSNK